MIDKELIAKINEFARISKERALTPLEEKQRDELRKEYVKQFKAGFRQTLQHVKVVDENGNEIKLKGDC